MMSWFSKVAKAAPHWLGHAPFNLTWLGFVTAFSISALSTGSWVVLILQSL